jgi:hypothetical protein
VKIPYIPQLLEAAVKTYGKANLHSRGLEAVVKMTLRYANAYMKHPNSGGGIGSITITDTSTGKKNTYEIQMNNIETMVMIGSTMYNIRIELHDKD